MARAPQNRTLTITPQERRSLAKELQTVTSSAQVSDIQNRIILGDSFSVFEHLPDSFVDLLIIDPPYNLRKRFGTRSFSARSMEGYETYVRSFIEPLLRMLTPNASVYVCSEWLSSAAVYRVLSEHVHVRNRITWEREKGRGAKANWKNASEDIWFATVSDTYTFNLDAVKQRRRVLAPYRDTQGKAKDWNEDGVYRDTHPSNLWTDISVPFWSMPENTEHPTQKPEKLIAKLILASSNEGDLVFDPFVGSGTTLATAHKLNRRWCGIEREKEYALITAKRVRLAETDAQIQGYTGGIFWERNSLQAQKMSQKTTNSADLPNQKKNSSSA